METTYTWAATPDGSTRMTLLKSAQGEVAFPVGSAGDGSHAGWRGRIRSQVSAGYSDSWMLRFVLTRAGLKFADGDDRVVNVIRAWITLKREQPDSM